MRFDPKTFFEKTAKSGVIIDNLGFVDSVDRYCARGYSMNGIVVYPYGDQFMAEIRFTKGLDETFLHVGYTRTLHQLLEEADAEIEVKNIPFGVSEHGDCWGYGPFYP